MPMRLTGLMSGLDTDSVIQELVMAKRTKVDNAKKAQTKLEWKTDVWKDLNSKLKSFQSKLNNLRFTGDYMKKTTKVSNSGVVSVLTGDTAVNSVQTLKIGQLAKTAYLTGGKMAGNVTALTNMQNLGLKSTKASLTGGKITLSDGSDVTKDTKLSELGIEDGTTFTVTRGDGTEKEVTLLADETLGELAARFKEAAGPTATFKDGVFSLNAFGAGSAADFTISASDDKGQAALNALGLSEESGAVKVDGEDAKANFTLTKGDGTKVDITLTERSTISDLMNQLKDAGLNVNFDTNQKRLFIVAQESGAAADFTISAAEGDEDSQKILNALGLASAPEGELSEEEKEKYATKIDGQDAVIYLNGARFSNSNNTFEINGLTITALAETDETITLTTDVDTDGIYDMIKDFIKSYSELINEMDKLYNADSAKGYEPLTDDEKEGMSDREIEEWEKKIKDSLLRRDEDLYSVNSWMQRIMSQGVSVNGKVMYLSDFGINTKGYFEADDNERHAYHIYGDEDGDYVDKTNDLKEMIATDPDTVVSFFTQLTQNLYSKMSELSKSVEGYRTFGNFYDDKKMKSDYDGYTSKIKDLEKKLTAYEDKWYNKFAQMESAMAKLQERSSSITSLLGG
ncbi:MAG: flagellar filament capping protein FliD [Acetatifactor sp.]|nr:flagellar filament capping protein FliD [Acetatifactor sp.]